MYSLLDEKRPPVFCPGCAHDRVVGALDKALLQLKLRGPEVAVVSDIGCSGLFDTFFNTHAMHGLHGRALTYATGLKMARPELNVVVTMGDGGLGIGAAHVLGTCRRNINVTLLVLNNFNYGMTGGQCSSTTPSDAQVGSGFLNQLEKPTDICQLARVAGAGYVRRISTYDKTLSEEIAKGIAYNGFALFDIWGICPGRYTKRNKLSTKMIQDQLAALEPASGEVPENKRAEYSQAYFKTARQQKPVSAPSPIEAEFEAPFKGRKEVVILGGAGQRIVTAGELLCLAGISAGLHATQKNDYPITVLRGHSVSDLVLSSDKIGFNGIRTPEVALALAPEGVHRRLEMLKKLPETSLIIKAKGIDLPNCKAKIADVDFREWGIKPADWALASLALLAIMDRIISAEMLRSALAIRYKEPILRAAVSVLEMVEQKANVQ